MNEDLYYCRNWEHWQYECYDVCVSDFAEDAGGSFIQIHCGVFRGNEVVRARSADIVQFERNVRAHVREYMKAAGMRYPGRDGNYTVKMWYYEPGGGKPDTGSIPLRTAITFYRPLKIADKEKDILIKRIFEEICGLLETA